MLPFTIPPVTPTTVVRPFAPAAHNWLPAHRGVDLATTPGQQVRAVRAGRVVLVRFIADRPVVVVRSAGVRFTFEPVTSPLAVGSRVSRGDPLGTIAMGGHCGGGCLHWGAKVDGEYVDPWAFLPRSAPVLKPLL